MVASVRRMTPLGRTDLDVFPLCLGGNVFGWTADEPESFAVLDAYTGAGGNFVDTANSYLVEHGRSETIIGRWMAERGNRDEIVLATKVGGGKGAVRSLRPETIEREAAASLERLRTDRIDLYYAHFDDEDTPLEDSLRAFDALVRAGTVRHLGASNYTAERLAAALDCSASTGSPSSRCCSRSTTSSSAISRAHCCPSSTTATSPCCRTTGWRRGSSRASTGRVARRSSPRVPRPPAPTSTTAARACSRRSTRSPPRTTRPSPRSRSHGCARIHGSSLPSRARGREQLEQILPAATLELSPDEVARLSDARG
jgi:aryl-alcohol dehydrogenase-like predicted oxidoreductase